MYLKICNSFTEILKVKRNELKKVKKISQMLRKLDILNWERWNSCGEKYKEINEQMNQLWDEVN